MSTLVQDKQMNKANKSTPGKEMHGLWLEASSMLKPIQDIKEFIYKDH